MADFNRERVVRTEKAVLKVDAGLPVGVHRFRLVVTDSAGHQSKPAEIEVEVVRALVTPRPGDNILRPPVFTTTPSTTTRSATTINSPLIGPRPPNR